MITLCCGRWFYAITITGDQPNHPWSCWTEIHRLWMQTEGQQNVFFIEFFLAEKDCHQNVFYSDKPPCVPSERVECSATILWLWVVEERAGEGQQDRGARPAQQGHQAPASLPWRRRWFVTSWSLFFNIWIPIAGIFEEDFIEERRAGLEGFINKIAGHPLAQNERCLHMFLQVCSASSCHLCNNIIPQEANIDKTYVPGKIRNT